MHNKNFINECIEGREKLVKTKEFKTFQKGYTFKMFIYNTIAFIAIVGFFMGFINAHLKGDYWFFIGLVILLSMLVPIINLFDAFLILVGIRNAPTDKWLEHIGEDEKRNYYETSNIYNTNLFNFDDFSRLEHQKLRFVFDDNKSYIYSLSGILLTDEPVKDVTITDKSYNEINSGVGNRVETKRIKKVYTKVIFADGKFITFLNVPNGLVKKFEQLML